MGAELDLTHTAVPNQAGDKFTLQWVFTDPCLIKIIIIIIIIIEVKGKAPVLFLTEYHAMKVYWGLEI